CRSRRRSRPLLPRARRRGRAYQEPERTQEVRRTREAAGWERPPRQVQGSPCGVPGKGRPLRGGLALRRPGAPKASRALCGKESAVARQARETDALLAARARAAAWARPRRFPGTVEEARVEEREPVVRPSPVTRDPLPGSAR